MPNENERSNQELQERTIGAEPLIAPDYIAGSISIPITEYQSTEMSLHDVHMLFLNGLGKQFERRFPPETYSKRRRMRIWAWGKIYRSRLLVGRFRDAYSVLRGYAEIRDPFDEEDHGYWDEE